MTSNQPHTGKAPRALVVLLLAAAILGGGVFGFIALVKARTAPPQQPSPKMIPEVHLMTVEAGPRKLTVAGYGTATYPRMVNLSAEVGGRVVWVDPAFRGGKAVQPKTVVRIDPEDYRLVVREIEAELELAGQNLAKLKQEQANQNALKTLTGRELELTRKDLEETRKLHAQGAASDQELRALQRTTVQRETSLQTIENRIETLPIDIRQQEATIERIRTRLDQARKNLARTEVAPPFAGRVVSESVALGMVVQPGVPFAVIGDNLTMEVPVSLSLDDLQYLPATSSGDGVDYGAIEAVVRWYGNRQLGAAADQVLHSRWSGRVARSETIDRKTRTVPLVVAVDKPTEALPGSTGRPVLTDGMFCQVELLGRPVPSAAVIPRTAMHEDGTVYVAVPADADNPDGNNLKLDIRRVTVAQADRDTVVVTDGLADGDRLVLTPLAYPIRGMALRVARSDKPAEASTESAP